MIDKSFKYFKWFFYFLIIISMIFSLIDRVNAQTITYTLSNSQSSDIWNNGNSFGLSWTSNQPFKNINSEGQILFNFSLEGKFKIYTIHIKTNNIDYACNYNSVVIYNDNTNQVQSLSVSCPTGWTGSTGLSSIIVEGESWNNNNVAHFGKYITFTDWGSQSDYSSVLGNIQTNSGDIITAIGYLRGDTQNVSQSITTQTTLLIQALNSNNSNVTNAINNNTTSINNINTTLNDSSIDSNNTTSSTTSWGNMNANNGTITNLLTLPIQLMQGYVNGMNSSCTPFNLGNLFGTNITLPCINIGALIGSSLWSVIDILFSGFMIFAIAKKLIKIFNDFTNMKSNQVDELYGGGA